MVVSSRPGTPSALSAEHLQLQKVSDSISPGRPAESFGFRTLEAMKGHHMEVKEVPFTNGPRLLEVISVKDYTRVNCAGQAQCSTPILSYLGT